jgi:hypothetical protein
VQACVNRNSWSPFSAGLVTGRMCSSRFRDRHCCRARNLPPTMLAIVRSSGANGHAARVAPATMMPERPGFDPVLLSWVWHWRKGRFMPEAI